MLLIEILSESRRKRKAENHFINYLLSDDSGHAIAILLVNLRTNSHKTEHERPNAQTPDNQSPVEEAIR